MNQERAQTDGTLKKKITESAKKRLDEYTKVTYSVYTTQYEEDHGFLCLSHFKNSDLTNGKELGTINQMLRKFAEYTIAKSTKEKKWLLIWIRSGHGRKP